MRRRVLAVLLVFATVAVVAFAVPLALATSAGRTAVLGANREADAHHFATLAVQMRAPGSTALLDEEVTRYHRLYDEGVLIVDARGAPRASADLTPTDPGVPEAITAGLRNQKQGIGGPLTPWSPQRSCSPCRWAPAPCRRSRRRRRVHRRRPPRHPHLVAAHRHRGGSGPCARHDPRDRPVAVDGPPAHRAHRAVAALTDSVPALYPRSRTGDATVSVRYHGPPEARELTQPSTPCPRPSARPPAPRSNSSPTPRTDSGTRSPPCTSGSTPSNRTSPPPARRPTGGRPSKSTGSAASSTVCSPSPPQNHPSTPRTPKGTTGAMSVSSSPTVWTPGPMPWPRPA